MKLLRALAPAALLATAVACGDGSVEPVTAGPELGDDVAQLVADVALQDVEMLLDAAASTADSDGRRWRAPANAVFLDGEGEVMAAYDPDLTAAVMWSFSRERERQRGNLSGTFSRTRSLTVSGLLGAETERVHDGEGTDARTRVVIRDDQGERRYDFESAVTIDAVVHAVDREARPWPLSGTITRDVRIAVVGARGGERSAERTSVLTFDGTRYATLEVNGERREVDLAERGERRRERGSGAGSSGPGG
jgi:hypothetical protein